MIFRFNKFFLFGVGAGFFLIGLYFLILTLANSFSHALSQFGQFWYWILALAAGFGTQAGLYIFIREAFQKEAEKNPTKVIAATAGVSTTAMAACCLHHFVDVLPLIGLAAFALFLSQYQVFFFTLGIFSNLIGIIMMLEIMQKNHLSENFTKILGGLPLSKLKKAVIGASVFLLIALIFLQFNKNRERTISIPANDLSGSLADESHFSQKTDSRSGITYSVKLLDIKQNESVRFEVSIETHSGSLDLDLVEISELEDGKGGKYAPVEWQGSGLGGHHRSGILVFPKITDFAGAKSAESIIKLTINDNGQRVFEWDI